MVLRTERARAIRRPLGSIDLVLWLFPTPEKGGIAMSDIVIFIVGCVVMLMVVAATFLITFLEFGRMGKHPENFRNKKMMHVNSKGSSESETERV